MNNLMKLFRENLRWIILFISVISFLFLAEDVLDLDIMVFDERGYNFISTHLISNIMTPIAKFITNFGGVYWLLGLTAVLFLVIKNKKMGTSIVLNLGIAGVINFILKQILQRPRPTEYRIIDESGYSFPSGHSMVSMAFYGYIIYLVNKNVKNKYIRIGLTLILSILIVSIGISRIYLGVHYTSDVIAGFLVALSYLSLYTQIAKRFI